MVNEERVILMTRMAAFEQDELPGHQSVVNFFRSDYISLQMVKTVIFTTVSFGILVGLYVMYDFELFMKEIYQMDLLQFIKTLIIIYVVMLAISMMITYVVSLYRYKLSLEKIRRYYHNLKKLSQLYGEEK